MQSVWNTKKEKLHTRKIEVTTYRCDGRRIIVEGVLTDDRFQDSHTITGYVFPSGTFHRMTIRLLVDCSNLVIEDVDTDLATIPSDICRETIDCLAPVKGLSITKGFTAKLKQIAGGTRGCTHLVELLQAMAPAVLQGFAAHQESKPFDFSAGQAKIMMRFLVDTCRTWREYSPLVERLKKKIDERSRTAGG